jgi:polypeptide N-acetylgalactosaminyltransferase
VSTFITQANIDNPCLYFSGVIAVGSAFAIRTDFFRDIGMYDPGLKIWGGENLELSFKVCFMYC